MSHPAALALVIVAAAAATATVLPMTEEDRVAQWYQKHGSWPPACWQETAPYRDMQMAREWEIMQLRGRDERWANWHQYVLGRMAPAFTDTGFKLMKAPPEIMSKLRAAVDAGLARWDDLETEPRVRMLYNARNLRPKFVDMQRLADEVMLELLPLAEQWSGLRLSPSSAYGVRLYRNGSSLGMHHDRIQTHVISAIVHIAHQYDDESHPWPLEIESHSTGMLSSVAMAEGDLLLYESAKSLHGRRSELRGKYYGSLYVHYAPVNKRIWNLDTQSVMKAIPPHWSVGAVEESEPYEGGACLTIPSRRAVGAPPSWTDRQIHAPRNVSLEVSTEAMA